MSILDTIIDSNINEISDLLFRYIEIDSSLRIDMKSFCKANPDFYYYFLAALEVTEDDDKINLYQMIRKKKITENIDFINQQLWNILHIPENRFQRLNDSIISDVLSEWLNGDDITNLYLSSNLKLSRKLNNIFKKPGFVIDNYKEKTFEETLDISRSADELNGKKAKFLIDHRIKSNSLELSDSIVNFNYIKYCGNKLKNLKLYYIPDRFVKSISEKCRNLKSLTILGNNCDEVILNNPNLEHIYLINTNKINNLINCKKLKTLYINTGTYLSSKYIIEDIINILNNCKMIDSIFISNLEIDIDIFFSSDSETSNKFYESIINCGDRIIKLSLLSDKYYGKMKINEEQTAKIFESCKNLEYLNFGSYISNHSGKFLSKKLKYLNSRYHPGDKNIFLIGMNDLKKLIFDVHYDPYDGIDLDLDGCHNLEFIDFNKISINDNTFNSLIKNCNNIKTFKCNKISDYNLFLDFLTKNKLIEFLSFDFSFNKDISNVFGLIPNILGLKITGASFSTHDIELLSKNCTNLKNLFLVGNFSNYTSTTDIKSLSNCKNLEILTLIGYEFDSNIIKDLTESLPNLKIFRNKYYNYSEDNPMYPF